MAAQPSGVSAKPPSFALSANLPGRGIYPFIQGTDGDDKQIYDAYLLSFNKAVVSD